MKRHNIKHQYVKPGFAELYVEVGTAKVILLTARCECLEDLMHLYTLAIEELTVINSVLQKVAA